jgi:hypothetical protein
LLHVGEGTTDMSPYTPVEMYEIPENMVSSVNSVNETFGANIAALPMVQLPNRIILWRRP